MSTTSRRYSDYLNEVFVYTKQDYRIDALVKAFPLKPFKAVADAARDREAETWKTGKRGKYFPYIQLPHVSFLKSVLPLVKRGNHFIDIGCGGGDKLAMVHLLGKPKVRLTGIEIDPITAKEAVRLCPFANIVVGDAIKHSYETYDVLYAYVPISDYKLWKKLQNRVAKTMKSGAVFVVFGASSGPDLKFKYDNQTSGNWGSPAIYRKP